MKYRLILFAILLSPLNVFAQENLQNALAKAQYMLRQVNAQKIATEQQLNTVNTEYADYKKEMESKLSKSESTNKKLQGTLAQWKESHAKLKEKLIETHKALMSEAQIRAQKEQALDSTLSEYKSCHNANFELVEVDRELLELYRKEKADGLDPIFGLGKVKLENLVQKYSNRIDDQILQNVLGYVPEIERGR